VAPNVFSNAGVVIGRTLTSVVPSRRVRQSVASGYTPPNYAENRMNGASEILYIRTFTSSVSGLERPLSVLDIGRTGTVEKAMDHVSCVVAMSVLDIQMNVRKVAYVSIQRNSSLSDIGLEPGASGPSAPR
jgi:hypothetical protein